MIKRCFNRIEFVLVIIIITGTHACKEEFSPFVTDIELNTIADIIIQNKEQFSYFIQLAEKGGLMDALDSYNPNGNSYTLFLPSNSAFEKFFAESDNYKNIDNLLNDIDYLRVLVRYHVLNIQIRSNDFPFGAFPDTTLSGDILTVGFVVGSDSTLYLINNIAPVSIRNIEASNGYIHVLEEVLLPVVLTSYEWLKANPDYSILTGVFEITNMKDKMGLTVETESGAVIENNYTLLADADSIFYKEGIYSTQDLIQEVSRDNSDYTSEDNPLYQFVAYHILEGVYFLDEFEGSSNYNTFGALPVRITGGAKLKINDDAKFHVFDTVITGNDTTYINYLEPIYNVSNVLTKNGAIHFLNHILFAYKPPVSTMRFEFFEEPVINSLSKINNTHIFSDQTPLTLISWTGTSEIIYYKTAGSERAANQDYIQIEGDFTISYKIPRVLPGRYQVNLRANSFDQSNAIVEVFVDGRKLGGNVNLTSGATSTAIYATATIGTIEFSNYESHLITVRSILPGKFTWDYIEFIPN